MASSADHGISSPKFVKHNLHVEFDPETGEFVVSLSCIINIIGASSRMEEMASGLRNIER